MKKDLVLATPEEKERQKRLGGVVAEFKSKSSIFRILWKYVRILNAIFPRLH